MKVGTPFGEYPFVYRKVERRDGEIAIVGTVAGVDSSVVFGRDDALQGGKVLAVAVAIATRVLRGAIRPRSE
jgi:hypothetical protein